jgi:hypothetical protein
VLSLIRHFSRSQAARVSLHNQRTERKIGKNEFYRGNGGRVETVKAVMETNAVTLRTSFAARRKGRPGERTGRFSG